MMIRKIIYAFVAVMTLAACSSDDFGSDMLTKSDESKLIYFAINTEKTVTRAVAERNYIAYNPATDPQSMSTFGLFGGYKNIQDSLIWNDMATFDSGNTVDSPTQQYKFNLFNEKHWADYDYLGDLDFFACMPYHVATTLVKNGTDDFTLSFPVTLEGGKPFVITEKPAKMGLICAAPARMDNSIGQAVIMQYDQILTGFQLKFQLGTMIRQFVIKSVALETKGLPKGGTVSRRYTCTDGNWGAERIAWNYGVDMKMPDNAADFEVPNLTGDPEVQTPIILQPGGEAVSWGKPFYAIPCTELQPKIKVVYDVELIDPDKDPNDDDSRIVTRKNVHGEIILNHTNFPTYMDGGELPDTGKRHTVLIKIMPDYLYVLADEDQKRGVLVVDTTAP